jgi:hypothetical protein
MHDRRECRRLAAVTLMELLCVIALIAILAGLLLGPVSRAMHRAWAMQWGQDAPVRFDAVVTRLQRCFQGRTDFPPVTLAALEAGGVLEPSQLRFLRDRRVTFTPFAGSDPDEQVVIRVRVDRGFLTEPDTLTATKGDLTRLRE